MERRATELGYAAIVCNTFASTEAEAAYVRMLLERGVEGMVFVACQLNDPAADHGHYARMLDKGARLVVVNGGDGSVRAPAVGVDEHEAGRLATQHLLDLGHTRIGFVAGPPHVRPTELKAAGREAALRRAGIEDGTLVAHGAFGVEGGRAALRELLARPQRPTAVICSSDLMAIGALQAAAEAGLRVPDDLSVVGFDGIEATEWTTPSLTTVAQPLAAIAEAAVDAAVALGEQPGRELPDVAFRPTLRVGASTAPPR
jgi:DNA-binding LacI/PurR family transcriptional regulator